MCALRLKTTCIEIVDTLMSVVAGKRTFSEQNQPSRILTWSNVQWSAEVVDEAAKCRAKEESY